MNSLIDPFPFIGGWQSIFERFSVYRPIDRLTLHWFAAWLIDGSICVLTQWMPNWWMYWMIVHDGSIHSLLLLFIIGQKQMRTDKQTGRQAGRQTDRQTAGRKQKTDRDSSMHSLWPFCLADAGVCVKTEIHTDIQTGRQANKQADRQRSVNTFPVSFVSRRCGKRSDSRQTEAPWATVEATRPALTRDGPGLRSL